jgi:4-hydroxybenzoate polyprenyltransferase
MLRSFLELLKISRPPLWIILPLIFCLGLAYGRNGLTDPFFRLTPLMIAQIFMLSFPMCLFTFGLNDIHDRASDRLNPRKRGFEGTLLAEGSQKIVKTAAVGVGVLFLCVSAASADPGHIYFAVTLLVFSYAYSSPPWRFKTRPPLDVVSAGVLGFLAPFGMGFSLVDNSLDLPFHAYFFTVCVMGFHAFSTISDYSADITVGDRTFAVAYGKRAAALLPALIFLSCLFVIRVVYIKVFFVACAALCFVSAAFPSERLARYSFLAMFLGAAVISGFWVLSLVFG